MVAGQDVTRNGSRGAAVVPGRLPLLGHTMSLLSRPFGFLSLLRSHTERIISEVLRKYPVLILMRRAQTDVEPGGVHIKQGTEVALSQYAVHHNPDLYPDPARFDPDRWLPDRTARLPKGAFIPFGAGPRHCPGYSLARTEITIVAATVAARWRLVPVAGKPVYPKLTVAMNPNRPPMITVPRRS